MSWAGKRVLLMSAFGTHSGYGRDGIHLVQALREADAEVHLYPLNVSVPLPPDIAMLFTAPRPKRFDLMLHHTDPQQLEANPAALDYCDRLMAWTMWEFTGFGGEKFEPEMQPKYAAYTDVLAYDGTTAEALATYVPENSLNILQGGYKAKGWEPPCDRDWSGTFKFCMVGSLSPRKNPFVAVNAFRLLKERYGEEFDAELHMKNLVRTLHPAMEQWTPGLKIHYEPWTHEQMREFYTKMHCLLAPSWGEGKNLPALEAATMGLPVIVSECGGHKQWFDSSMGWMTQRSTWEEHDHHRKPGQFSLRVQIEELADLMWEAYTDRALCQQKGVAGSQLIPAQCDWANVIEKMSVVCAI